MAAKKFDLVELSDDEAGSSAYASSSRVRDRPKKAIETIEISEEEETQSAVLGEADDSDLEIIEEVPFRADNFSRQLERNLKLGDGHSEKNSQEKYDDSDRTIIDSQATIISSSKYDSDRTIIDYQQYDQSDDHTLVAHQFDTTDVEYVNTSQPEQCEPSNQIESTSSWIPTRSTAPDRLPGSADEKANSRAATRSMRAAEQSSSKGQSKSSSKGSSKNPSKGSSKCASSSSLMKSPDDFCYICGLQMSGHQLSQANKITNYQRVYEEYFDQKAELNSFTPSLICEGCRKHLIKFKYGLLDRKTFQSPCKWPLDYSASSVVEPVRFNYKWRIVDKKTKEPVRLTYADYMYNLLKKVK